MAVAALAAGVLTATAGLRGEQAAQVREVRLLMGTTAEVRAGLSGDASPALDAAFAALDAVDRSMSLWQPSELIRLNEAGAGCVSQPLFDVIAHSLEMAQASRGAFDPTVEPLVRASGHLGGASRPVSDKERLRLMRRVGYRGVTLERDRRCVRLRPGSRLDLGGIAKGYAVDGALAALREKGAHSALVDLGGSSLGAFGEPVLLQVRDPRAVEGSALAELEVRDRCVGTAGNDQRPGHIVDPRTGKPAAGVLAVTVIASTAMEADALDTAVYVLGVEEGIALLKRRKADGLVLTTSADGAPLIRTTQGFAAAYRLQPLRGTRVVE